MGIDIAAVELLCCAKSIGVDFSDTITIGRQTMYAPPDTIASILGLIGIEQDSDVLQGQFAEPLFGLLGAKKVSSVDVSDYERATDIQDFNEQLSMSLANRRFSVVYEGGTIEHVFNITQAFKNCMEMVRVGGHFIQINVANNYMGHGFWQFSPDLMYRIFSRENGFEIKAILLNEHTSWASFGTWYKVEDPAVFHSRVELINDKPTYICTIAQRVEEGRIFGRFPQQSFYVELWRPQEARQEMTSEPEFRIRRLIPRPIKKLVRWGRDAVQRRGPFERPYYCRISGDDIVRGRIHIAA